MPFVRLLRYSAAGRSTGTKATQPTSRGTACGMPACEAAPARRFQRGGAASNAGPRGLWTACRLKSHYFRPAVSPSRPKERRARALGLSQRACCAQWTWNRSLSMLARLAAVYIACACVLANTTGASENLLQSRIKAVKQVCLQ